MRFENMLLNDHFNRQFHLTMAEKRERILIGIAKVIRHFSLSMTIRKYSFLKNNVLHSIEILHKFNFEYFQGM